MLWRGRDKFVTLYLRAQVGKTSLISTLVSETFSKNQPKTLNPVQMAPDMTTENTLLTIVDTPSSQEPDEGIFKK